MSHWRVLVLLLLAAAPVVFLAGLGSYFLWERHWGFAAWWPMFACWAAAYALGWYWARKQSLLRRPDFSPPAASTERDRQAWQLVEARAQRSGELPPDRLLEFSFYVDTAQEMALELARSYHPGATDPIAQLTIPEILAVVELAAHDLAQLVDQYLPGGHLLTINHLRQARKAADWYQTANTVYWLVAALFSPVETGLRYAASQVGVSRPWQMLQQNLLVWFYTAYVHRVGAYLIEVNSGRLRVGVERYRELVQGQPSDGQALAGETRPEPAVQPVTITVMGQVKSGKSSFINALLGEQQAQTDVLPMTSSITRYQLQPEGMSARFVLLDTVGYGHTGPKEDQVKATQEAVQQSDLVCLVLHARNPARQADVEMLEALQSWFRSHPALKMPPILGVLTHMDLLSPAMEWAPPYHWERPEQPKERQIQQAHATVREQLGQYLVGCVPVCTAQGRVYGIEEWLLPTMVELLDEAKSVALLRCLKAEADAGKIRKVFQQLLAAGQQIGVQLWQAARSGTAP
ncbi:MAG TPA: GTPase [Gemmataceae bacterium]|nr:GTPase [Gemmataceae bacterium]